MFPIEPSKVSSVWQVEHTLAIPTKVGVGVTLEEHMGEECNT